MKKENSKINIGNIVDTIEKEVFYSKHTGMLLNDETINNVVNRIENIISKDARMMLKDLMKNELKDFFKNVNFLHPDILKEYRQYMVNKCVQSGYPNSKILVDGMDRHPEEMVNLLTKYMFEKHFETTNKMIELFLYKPSITGRFNEDIWKSGNSLLTFWNNDLKIYLCGELGLGEKGIFIKNDIFLEEDLHTYFTERFGEKYINKKIIGDTMEYKEKINFFLNTEKSSNISKRRAFKYLLNTDNFDFQIFHNLLHNETESLSHFNNGSDWIFM